MTNLSSFKKFLAINDLSLTMSMDVNRDWVVHIKGAFEVKDHGMLRSVTGCSKDPREAIEELAKQLQGETIVQNAMDKVKRREIVAAFNLLDTEEPRRPQPPPLLIRRGESMVLVGYVCGACGAQTRLDTRDFKPCTHLQDFIGLEKLFLQWQGLTPRWWQFWRA